MALRTTSAKMNTVQIEKTLASEQRLSASEVERLAGVRSGDAIVCNSGILWVTQEGDPEDYLLKKGEQFVANRHGVVVVEAMTDSAVSFSRRFSAN